VHTPEAQEVFEVQACWSGHDGAHDPATHAPAVQMPDAQFSFSPHSEPGGHVGEQLGATHLPVVQTPDAQSVDAPHATPEMHDGAQGEGAQTPSAQTSDAQSADARHTLPSGQLGLHAGGFDASGRGPVLPPSFVAFFPASTLPDTGASVVGPPSPDASISTDVELVHAPTTSSRNAARASGAWRVVDVAIGCFSPVTVCRRRRERARRPRLHLRERLRSMSRGKEPGQLTHRRVQLRRMPPASLAAC